MPNALFFCLKDSDGVWAAIGDEGGAFSVRLGRGRECEVAVPDGAKDAWTVSRVHARFFRRGGDYWVEDLHSKNLTYVDGKVILSPTKVRVPCELRMGNVLVCVERKTVTSKELMRFNPLPPANREVPATRGLDQLGTLLDARIRAILDQVREEIHWGSALQYLMETLSASRRAEEAELRLEQAFEVYLDAKEISLGIDIACEGIEDFLHETGIKKGATTLAKKILSTISQGSRSSIRLEIPEAHVRLWVSEALGGEAGRVSLLLAGLPRQRHSSTERTGLDRVIDLTLQTATPFVVALREVEAQRATVAESVTYLPSTKMLKACEDAAFRGESPQFLKMLYEAERAAVSYLKERKGHLPVLMFLGESGVGKSTLARIIHRLSDHSQGEFVEVNCATISENLAESELFGHEKGSFTGADQQRKGFFEVAGGGTLFLDEIGTMGPVVQSKLLSVLDTGAFRRVGGSEVRHTNSYVILATNEEPEELVKKGSLREDLWYRIQTLTIALPPLRKRINDMDRIVNACIDSLNAQLSPPVPRHVTDRLKRALKTYSWPGNVRQLVEGVEAAYRMSRLDKVDIDVDDLPARLCSAIAVSDTEGLHTQNGVDTGKSLADNVQRLEREYLIRLLCECEGVKTRAASRANISPQTLYNKLEEFRAWLLSAEGRGNAKELSYLKELAGPHWDMLAGAQVYRSWIIGSVDIQYVDDGRSGTTEREAGELVLASGQDV